MDIGEKRTARQRILVTGATGFIGRYVVRRLLLDGHLLSLVVRSREKCLPEWYGDQRIKIFESGPLDEASALPALADAWAVVHLAGLAGLPRASGAEAATLFKAANADATARLVSMAAKADIRCFVYMSSIMAVSGHAVPQTLDEKTVPAPASSYGRSKLAAEGHVGELAGPDRLCVSLRPPLVVGAEAKSSWLGIQRLAATGIPLPFSNLANRRSLISAVTLGEAVSILCSRAWPAAMSGAYMLADHEPLSIGEMISELRSGMSIPPRLFWAPGALLRLAASIGGIRAKVLTGDMIVDASRFNACFGFRPSLPLREAIRHSGASYLAHVRQTAAE